MSPLSEHKKKIVLIAEDDQDDQLLLREVFREFEDYCEIRFVEDGEELMEYLLPRNRDAGPAPPRPGLILLDLNMPKKDGRQALLEIKQHPELKDIPLIVWTTSTVEEDRIFCAQAGATGYVTKPSSYGEMVDSIKDIVKTWLQLSAFSGSFEE